MNVVAVIPAFRPGGRLVELVEALARSGLPAVIVVNDGSGPDYESCFAALPRSGQVHLLEHAVNLGKGAALKTGINYALCRFPGCAGVVTADADGQHHPEDILRVACALAEQPQVLVLGVRSFTSGVPLRSRLGNALASVAARLLLGQRLTDTQTGLRGIPAFLLPRLLTIPSAGYEFELDMLIAARHQSCPVVQEPIRTIYQAGGQESYFRPLRDSMRVGFVLLRFTIVSLLTAVVDNAAFALALSSGADVLRAQVVGRLAAVGCNYWAARRAVFLSHQPHLAVAPKYLLLVGASGAVSYGLIRFLTASWAVAVIPAKLLVESLLFIANFAVQRDFVFREAAPSGEATDWERYYRVPAWTARLARRYTARVLVRLLERFAGGGERRLSIVELGGGDSCFLAPVLRRMGPCTYHVVDNNPLGLELARRRHADAAEVLCHQQDVRELTLRPEADVVFSVGLVEHFDPAGTRQAIRAHFDLLRPGGCAIISFPTPTWLYRAARRVAEALGVWRFPDERPLTRGEVLDAAGQQGRVVYEKTLWPLVFAQHLVVIRKPAQPPG